MKKLLLCMLLINTACERKPSQEEIVQAASEIITRKEHCKQAATYFGLKKWEIERDGSKKRI